jgi:hypothetical protein
MFGDQNIFPPLGPRQQGGKLMIGLASADGFHYRLSCTTGRYNIKDVRNSIKWQWDRRHYYYCTAATSAARGQL